MIFATQDCPPVGRARKHGPTGVRESFILGMREVSASTPDIAAVLSVQGVARLGYPHSFNNHFAIFSNIEGDPVAPEQRHSK